MKYFGHAHVTFDAKGRFQFPAKFRDEVLAHCGGHLMVVHDFKGCLTVYPRPVWNKKVAVLSKLPQDAQRFVSYFVGSSEPIDLDNAGRLTLTPELRDVIHLTPGPAIIRATGHYFELWTLAQDKRNTDALQLIHDQGLPASLANVVIDYED